MNEFRPRLEILPPPQRRLWEELVGVPNDFVLYGGTAIALHLGHRYSVDFDFIADREINPARLQADVPFLSRARVLQREPNTLTVSVERGGEVQVSFFGAPKLPRLRLPHRVRENGLQIASLLDLAGMKAEVIQLRAEPRDYIDMHAILVHGEIDLPAALAAGQRLFGATFNPEITLKALSYYEDGDLRTLSVALKCQLAAAARKVDLERLPDINVLCREDDLDRGLEP